jgi:hypothetical protein
MTDLSRAAQQLQLYQRYSSMARQALNDGQRAAYGRMARDALRLAAKLDPAAVANASAAAMSNAKHAASQSMG